MPQSILLLAADPKNSPRLRLGEEAREVRAQLQRSKLREQFDLHERVCVRPEDLTQAMLDISPDIVHFSGHGTQSGDLCFEDGNGLVKPISAGALKALFGQFNQITKCVILNACYSEKQAESIVTCIEFVIGMNTSINDKAAIAFSTGFYQAFGAGCHVEQAFKFGCIQIELQGFEEHLTPILLKRN